MTIIPCILSGGSGMRLWPVSRMLHPKRFMRLPNGRTLLSCAFERATAVLEEAQRHKMKRLELKPGPGFLSGSIITGASTGWWLRAKLLSREVTK